MFVGVDISTLESDPCAAIGPFRRIVRYVDSSCLLLLVVLLLIDIMMYATNLIVMDPRDSWFSIQSFV